MNRRLLQSGIRIADRRMWNRAVALAGLALISFAALGCREQKSPLTVSDVPTVTPSVTPAGEGEKILEKNPLANPAKSIPAETATPPSDPTKEPGQPAETGQPTDDGPPKTTSGRPKADRTPTKPGEAEKITFDDLIIGMQADIPFRPWMLEDRRPQELEGKLVRLSGLMHGGAAAQKNLREFVLLRNTECKFGPGGQADHLARIFLAEGVSAHYTNLTVVVEGKLSVEPFEGADGNTWAIYRLDNAKIR